MSGNFELFRKHSRTYFSSSLLFPTDIRQDVAILYSFVRIPDELVDNPVADPASELATYRRQFTEALAGTPAPSPVIAEFVDLMKRKEIPAQVPLDFLSAMAMDLTTSRYQSFHDLQHYTYGSAETVGLMMASLMGVDSRFHPHARLLGLSMQLTNFIRDIGEDFARGRLYLPLEDLDRFGLDSSSWSPDVDPGRFGALIRFEIGRIRDIQREAEMGFPGIPLASRRAVQMASELYLEVLDAIARDPMVVWRRSLKPNAARLMWKAMAVVLFNSRGGRLPAWPRLAAARRAP